MRSFCKKQYSVFQVCCTFNSIADRGKTCNMCKRSDSLWSGVTQGLDLWFMICRLSQDLVLANLIGGQEKGLVRSSGTRPAHRESSLTPLSHDKPIQQAVGCPRDAVASHVEFPYETVNMALVGLSFIVWEELTPRQISSVWGIA